LQSISYRRIFATSKWIDKIQISAGMRALFPLEKVWLKANSILNISDLKVRTHSGSRTFFFVLMSLAGLLMMFCISSCKYMFVYFVENHSFYVLLRLQFTSNFALLNNER
jgi:hypothetical protein